MIYNNYYRRFVVNKEAVVMLQRDLFIAQGQDFQASSQPRKKNKKTKTRFLQRAISITKDHVLLLLFSLNLPIKSEGYYNKFITLLYLRQHYCIEFIERTSCQVMRCLFSLSFSFPTRKKMEPAC